MYSEIARNKRRAVEYVVAFVLVWLGVGALLGWISTLAGGAQPAGSSPAGTRIAEGIGIAAVLALGAVAFSLLSGARLVLSIAGAKPADRAGYPQLYNLIEALATGDGLPMPAVYVIDDPSPNAFATGISPAHAAITVTSGLLTVMDREQLEGVLGHEMSHIKNYDTRLLLIVATLVGMAGLLASLAWRSSFITRGRGRNGGQVTLVVMAAAALLTVVGFLVGPLLRLALSRRRESLADASSVELTRNPVGLIRALRTLQDNDTPLRKANHATAAMCIDDPIQHHQDRFHALFATHPPIAERIAALQEIEQVKSL